MTSYYTRAKARSDLEGEELEQREVAPVATTSTSASILPVGLYDAPTGESESVSAETAGPATTHRELSPAGDHPSVGGRGTLGSADSPLVGVTTLGCPSGHADPLDSAFSGLVGTAEVATTADTTRTPDLTSRQPPTVAEVTAAASRSPTLPLNMVDTPPTRGRRRSSSAYTLSPPTLSPVYTIEQSQSVPVRIVRAASLQRRSQRPPSLSPTQWTGSYGSPSPLIGSDIETDYPAARPTVYQPRSIEASQAPLQVDSRPRTFPGISLAAEVQPSSLHVASTRTYTRSDIPIISSDIGQPSFEPMHIDAAAHPHVSPSIIADVAPLPITVAAQHQLPVDVRKPMSSVGRR